MLLIKYCPYCVKRLSFWSIVLQRIFAKDKDALKCNNCHSSISIIGSAKTSLIFGSGGMAGYAIGHAIGRHIEISWVDMAILIVVVFSVCLVFVYLLAPIKEA